MPTTMVCPACWGAKKDRSRRLCKYCSAEGTVPDQQLSDNFSLSEMLYSPTAVRASIPNDPTPEQVQHLAAVCHYLLEPIRVKFGPLHINSGLRQPELNAAIGGSSKTSAHQLGYAADLIPMAHGSSLKSVVDWVISFGIAYDQVIYEGTWVHVGLVSPDGTVRKQALMMFGGKYSPYDPKDPRVV